MITQHDVLKFVESRPDMTIEYFNQRPFVKFYEGGIPVKCVSLEQVVREIQREGHCDLEIIYSDPGSLDVIYRCNECGTVIFSGDDERFDANLVCPVCDPRYKDKVEFWTKSEIENSVYKHDYYEHWMKDTRVRRMEVERRKRRGKFDWQILRKQINLFGHRIFISLDCDDLFADHFKYRGLRLMIENWDENQCVRCTRIPLSISFARSLYRDHKKRKFYQNSYNYFEK